jgi:hypothetical protein
MLFAHRHRYIGDEVQYNPDVSSHQVPMLGTGVECVICQGSASRHSRLAKNSYDHVIDAGATSGLGVMCENHNGNECYVGQIQK